MDSRDGYTWTPTDGLKAGVSSLGVITPSTNLSESESEEFYDVIVVGAGYCGLTAARNAAVGSGGWCPARWYAPRAATPRAARP